MNMTEKVCLDTGVLWAGGAGPVILDNFTPTLSHSFSKSHSLSLDFLLIEEIAVGPGELRRVLYLCFSGACGYWFLVLVAKYPDIPGLKIKCISKELPLFPGSYPVLQTRFLHVNSMSVETHVICLLTEGFASCYGMCPFIHWRI